MKRWFQVADGGCALLAALSTNCPSTNPWATYVLSVVTNLQQNDATEFVSWTDDGFVVTLEGPADTVTGVQLSRERPHHPGSHTLRIGLGVVELNLFLGRWLTGFHLPWLPLPALAPFLGETDIALRKLELPPLSELFGSELPLSVAFGVKASVAGCEDEKAVSSRIALWSSWWKAGYSRSGGTNGSAPL
jgi:hypothetical protein